MDLISDGSLRSTPSSSPPIASSSQSKHQFTSINIGIINSIFWAAFLVLMYTIYRMTRTLRRRGLDSEVTVDQHQANNTGCGVEEAIIQVLPTFSFSSLKGNKEGLECAVCLSRYADSDVLRLLSRCKHAFHIDCVDIWLRSHSTCPLCRCQISEEDPLLADGIRRARVSSDIALSTPRRSLEIGSFQIFVKRDDGEISARVGRRPQTLLPENMPSDIGGAGTTPLTDEASFMLRRFSHTIIVSDHVVMQTRWSNFVPADLLFLIKKQNLISCASNSDRKNQINSLNAKADGGTTKDPEAGTSWAAYECKDPSFSDQRSMSEITGLKRYASFNGTFDGKSAEDSHSDKQDEEKQKWLSIIKTTLNWIMGTERIQITKSLHPNLKGHNVFL